MRVTKIICDRCHEEIKGYPIEIVPHYVDRETGESTIDQCFPSDEDVKQAGKEYCERCLAKILACANGIADNPEFSRAVKKMIRTGESTEKKSCPGIPEFSGEDNPGQDDYAGKKKTIEGKEKSAELF